MTIESNSYKMNLKPLLYGIVVSGLFFVMGMTNIRYIESIGLMSFSSIGVVLSVGTMLMLFIGGGLGIKVQKIVITGGAIKAYEYSYLYRFNKKSERFTWDDVVEWEETYKQRALVSWENSGSYDLYVKIGDKIKLYSAFEHCMTRCKEKITFEEYYQEIKPRLDLIPKKGEFSKAWSNELILKKGKDQRQAAILISVVSIAILLYGIPFLALVGFFITTGFFLAGNDNIKRVERERAEAEVKGKVVYEMMI